MTQPVALERATSETNVRVSVKHGDGPSRIETDTPFLTHMLTTFATYAGLEISLDARGDLKHHTIEDAAITLGSAVRLLIVPGVARYGERTVPMDDALVQCALDAGGRFFYRGPLPSALYDHWARSFADAARITLHLRVLRGRDRHHIVEAAFKALGLSLRAALTPARAGEFSTKGAVIWNGRP
jgi:imidazoleglycerol-phosphate dehydratase